MTVTDRVISVVAALIRDEEGRVLLVRKRGTLAFMQPGGKRDAGETDVAALSREIVEELGCRVDQATARALGIFECAAANEPGYQVRAAVYAINVEGAISPQAEIDQIVWVNPKALPDLPLAPLTRDHILPLVL
jgi:8-oxo-dGTP diphosphatase